MSEQNKQNQVPELDEQSLDTDLVKQIKASAKEIWLAGLALFPKKSRVMRNKAVTYSAIG